MAPPFGAFDFASRAAFRGGPIPFVDRMFAGRLARHA
jgi:hypothetical protein